MGVPFWMTWSGESQQTSALVMACFVAVTHCCQRKLGSNTSELRTNRILILEMMKGGMSSNNIQQKNTKLSVDLDERW